MENQNDKLPKSSLEAEAMQDSAIAKVNKKVVIVTLAVIVLLGAAIGIYFWMHSAGEKKAAEAMGRADIEMNDSTQFSMYKKIADDGSYKANERAKLMVAIKYYNDGKYEEALKYLQNASVDSEVIETGALSLEGDCQANLGKLDEALKCYSRALDSANENPLLVPYVMLKQANIYHAQKAYDKELEIYTTMRKDYPSFLPDVEKYYERAKVAAGK